ncbi:MAG: preprotein translocase subunit SecA [Alphaproteobacteria bacterium]|nr:preprotein translocase subunit SecA [Alphaproteobacteria bacterium]
MLLRVAKKVLGSANDRIVKKEKKILSEINMLEPKFEALSDKELKAYTKKLQKKLADGATEDSILPEAFALVREAAKRTLKQRHYDVQIIGGIMLHRGNVVEMKTGEGKTLVSTLPVFLNALSGKGVHVVTVNDYLAQRDSEWMGQVHRFLGLSVGVIVHDMDDQERKEMYACDITYGTNNEFGFDHLRDNMKFALSHRVQRPFNYAIVDEVDSILIDEARTPLIISGASTDSSDLYRALNKVVPNFKPEHYKIEEKDRNVMLTEEGNEFAEKLLKKEGVLKSDNLYDLANAKIVHHLDQALTAHLIYKRDVHYLVRENEVHIIDEFTGRVMEGRRYSGGLHQAIEAKENVHVKQENQTLASITYQNYFRMYPKLSGMTGTALTEASEFAEIYKLECVAVPTHRPVARKDYDDDIFRTAVEKYGAIAALIKECNDRKQPVLVGTISIEKSEELADFLKKEYNITRIEILNAKHHEREAEIVAQAGIPGAITIATNMAGRGTDIQLGGNLDMYLAKNPDLSEKEIEKLKEKIKQDKQTAREAGGLFVIGTERHESRRIDNQLRGRSGRQGDPGASKFFLSLEDDLMRIFGSDKLSGLLKRFGLKEGEAITHPWVSKALEKAQGKVEAHHFEIRKNLLKYDDVINEQRKTIYAQRLEVMESDDVSEKTAPMIRDVVEDIVSSHIPQFALPEDWNIPGMDMMCRETLNLALPLKDWCQEEGITDQILFDRILEATQNMLTEKAQKYSKIYKRIERNILLESLDNKWKDHLAEIDELRRTIHLQSFGQKDPFQEYQKKAFMYFGEMMNSMALQTVNFLCRMNFSPEDLHRLETLYSPQETEEHTNFLEAEEELAPVDDSHEKVGRNQPCPCGSGKKYKHCCGKL